MVKQGRHGALVPFGLNVERSTNNRHNVVSGRNFAGKLTLGTYRKNMVQMNKPIIDKKFLVEKRVAKSGFKYSNWTYVVLTDFPTNINKQKGGTIKVKGFIDSYELKQYSLLPMKDNCMLLPLKASIRNKIKKKEGDHVYVVLYLDDSSLEIPEDLMVCLLDYKRAHDFFFTLSESNQKYYIDWIITSKSTDTKVIRITKTIERLENRLKFYDWAD